MIGLPPWLRRPGDKSMEPALPEEKETQEDHIAKAERAAAERIFASMEAKKREAQRKRMEQQRTVLRWRKR